MLTIPWNSNTGWGTPEIKPCEPPNPISGKADEQMLPYVWTLLLLSSITLSHCQCCHFGRTRANGQVRGYESLQAGGRYRPIIQA
jgi:hypothetical protein